MASRKKQREIIATKTVKIDGEMKPPGWRGTVEQHIADQLIDDNAAEPVMEVKNTPSDEE